MSFTDLAMQPNTYTDNRWDVVSSESNYVRRGTPLHLVAEPNLSAMSDDYGSDEITAYDLFQLWLERARQEDGSDDRYPVSWYVAGDQLVEFTPWCVGLREFNAGQSHPLRNFSDFFYPPRHSSTGELLNWARLPVRTGGWSRNCVTKCGFIYEATGWIPAPFQASVSLDFLEACAEAELSRGVTPTTP